MLGVLVAKTRRVLPKGTWPAAGIGQYQAQVLQQILEHDGLALGSKTRSTLARTGWRAVMPNGLNLPPAFAKHRAPPVSIDVACASLDRAAASP
jgi:hypothetical protein